MLCVKLSVCVCVNSTKATCLSGGKGLIRERIFSSHFTSQLRLKPSFSLMVLTFWSAPEADIVQVVTEGIKLNLCLACLHADRDKGL